MATWNSLPREMRQMVLEAVVTLSEKDAAARQKDAAAATFRRKPRLALFATVCREWQAVLEPAVFGYLQLNSKHLTEFDNIMRGERRKMLRHLWFRIELSKRRVHYDEDEKLDEEEDNNALFTIAMVDLFKILSTWGRGSGGYQWPGFELELGAQAPNDPKYVFGDPGITCNEDYCPGELDFCFVDGNKRFSYPCPLPEVNVISTVSLLRRTRRFFSPQALLTIFDCLPRLHQVRYEPWWFLNEESQADADEAFGRYFRHWPSTVKRISIFEFSSRFRRHFPGEPLDFEMGPGGFWPEYHGLENGHDNHGHHHHHHHHHHHPSDGGDIWVADDGDGTADEEGWETANEDDDGWEDETTEGQGNGSSVGNSGADNSASSEGIHSPFPLTSSPFSLLPNALAPAQPNGLSSTILNALFGSSAPPSGPSGQSSQTAGAGPGPASAAATGTGAGGSGGPGNGDGAAGAGGQAAGQQGAAGGEDENMEYPVFPHLGLGLLFIRPSQRLEELAVFGAIDARDFFEPFYSKPEAGQASLPTWDNMRWLALSSPTLMNPSPVDGGVDAVNDLLQAAGRAASRMPKLQVMELYCTDERGGVVFRYQVTDTSTSIEWQSAWAPRSSSSGGGAGAADAEGDTIMDVDSDGEDDEDHPRHFRVGAAVKETWGRVARKHTRNDLDPIFETALPWSSPFDFIHQNLVTRELVISQTSSRDILRTHDLPPPLLKLPSPP